MPDRPHGTVAFLFTDIEGSTRLWEAHPAAMPVAYARHDEIVRTAVAAAGGIVYKVIGDAYQAAFWTTADAVRAAVTMQTRLGQEPWSRAGLPEPLRVRIALHAGAVDPDVAGDYRAPVLNRLGRLLGVGHGGQVLLTLAAAELVRDHLPATTALADLGERRLKDLNRPERIYQLLHPELAAEFAPLATLDRRPHNLPVQPTPLIGRTAEIAAVRALLEREHAWVVTLTGPGGVGKTRLALQVAADLVDVFSDGAFFVPLAAITEQSLVASTIAAVLGLREEPAVPIVTTLTEYLRERELLLVLDNFEQVLEGAETVVALLAAAPGLRVVTTSRSRLGVRGEREFVVPPLSLPDPSHLPAFDQLGQYEAVRLFVHRAVEARPSFTVTNETAAAVAEICVRLDGLPLAIELAAASVKLLGPEALLRRLDQRLALLIGGARDLPRRHQTLRAAIAWSYELLTREEQQLFRRLAIFAGGWTLEAAETVVGRIASGDLNVEVFAGLVHLVDHSLLRQEEGPGGEPRFTMLETIREYGLEHLARSGEAEQAHERHAAWCLALVESTDPSLTQAPLLANVVERLEVEQENVRAALLWVHQHHEKEFLLRLTSALTSWWITFGRLTETAEWLNRAVEGGRDGSPAMRARVFAADAEVAWLQGDYRRSAERGEAALALWRELGRTRDMCGTLIGLGLVALNTGVLHRAEISFDEALALGRASGETDVIAVALTNLGSIAIELVELSRARTYLEEALPLARKSSFALPSILHNLGAVSRLEGDLAEARVIYRQGLEAAAAVRDLRTMAESLLSLAKVSASIGCSSEAARLVGSFEAVLTMAGVTRDFGENQSYRQMLSELRATLGDAAFSSAWTAGLSLSLDEAVAEGLGLSSR